MKVTRLGLVGPLLLGAMALGFAPLARAQSEAVTQFAPLDDAPVPTAPGAPAANGDAPSPPQYGFAQPSALPAVQPVVSPTPSAPSPAVGSSWLAAPTAVVPETPPSVVDSGLPVFVQPGAPTTRDVVVKEKEQTPEENEETHRVALTFSLARAFLLPAVVPGNVKDTALYEGTIELKVFERLSVAVIGGVGGFDVPLSQLAENVHVNGKELGGQARIYVLGDFDHGLTLGGEYLRVWAEADPINVAAVPPPPLPAGTGVLTGEATLTGLGGFVGYKVTAGFGLTFDAKLGVQKLTAVGEGTVSGDIGPGYPTLTESETFRYEQLVPLINVNVGWAI